MERVKEEQSEDDNAQMKAKPFISLPLSPPLVSSPRSLPFLSFLMYLLPLSPLPQYYTLRLKL